MALFVESLTLSITPPSMRFFGVLASLICALRRRHAWTCLTAAGPQGPDARGKETRHLESFPVPAKPFEADWKIPLFSLEFLVILIIPDNQENKGKRELGRRLLAMLKPSANYKIIYCSIPLKVCTILKLMS